MGQCLSFAKPLVEEVLTDLANEAKNQQSAQQGSSDDGSPAAAAAADAPSPSSASSDFGSGSGSSGGAVHSSLPSDAEKHTVRNVYDGDTLTLTDERRVRLLGVDTPEIKERQPHAEEAKAYTKDRCHKREIWIAYNEPEGGEREDKYGRLLCFVYVPANEGKNDDGKYLCVNEGLVEAGYARAYHPGRGKRLHNWDGLIALQSLARRERRGLWSEFEDIPVVKTANGAAYHKRSCEHLRNSRNLTELMASEGVEQGLHPCRTCFG